MLSLPSLTKHLNHLADRDQLDGAALAAVLTEKRPGLLAQIRADLRTELLEAWGRSSNLDSGSGKPSVHPGLLRALSELTGIAVEGQTFHAGLLHTYGYLLSNQPTPFGLKRSRWCKVDFTRGLGIAHHWLSPQPREGTLLANLTRWMLFSFGEGNPEPWFPAQPTVHRYVELAEEVALETHTLLIPFQRSQNQAALLHAYRWRGRLQLISAFPTNPWLISKWQKNPSRAIEIRPRYNACFPNNLQPMKGRSNYYAPE